MAGYRLGPMELLKDQLLYTPRRVLREQVVRLYDLVCFDIDPLRTYPYDFLCHRITGYRPASDAEALFEGRDLEADLSRMLLELSARAAPAPTVFREPVYGVAELGRLFGVGPRTVLRWQEYVPLAGCYVQEDGGERRLVFRFAAVLRFIRDNPALVDGMGAEVLIGPRCRERVVVAARRSRKRTGSLTELAEHLGRKLKLSPALVECVLALDLEEHPELRVYRNLTPALSEAESQQAATLFTEGWSFSDIARELGCDRKATYRAVCRQKAEEILAAEVAYVDSPEFHQRGAEARIFAEPESVARGESGGRARPPAVGGDAPPYIRELYRSQLLTPERERWLFRKYNFAKFRMGQLREQVRQRRYAISLVRAYQRFQEEMLACRRELVRSNLRLVVSIAKRHLGSHTSFESLVSDGNMSLLAAIEKFDYTRGFKFSTYASWAIIKNFAKSIPEENYRLRTYVSGVSELMEQVAAERGTQTEPGPQEEPRRPLAQVQETVSQLLDSLSEREQFILAARFGLAQGDGGGSLRPQTLEEVGQRLSLSRERVRQLEKRALDRLRDLMEG